MMTTVIHNDLIPIGRVAQAVGVPATTLRYYEREGILAPSIRSRAGYRLYNPDAVERLEFIRSAQAVGFTLDDIRALLQLNQADKKTCRSEVQTLLTQRLSQVDEKMKELQRVRDALGQALDRCRHSKGECAVLKNLRPKKETKR